MGYVVMFNTANAIASMPTTRRIWERQLIDDFIRAIHRKQYACDSYEELIKRLEFIAGHGGHGISWDGEGNHVKLDNPKYDERILPIQMYGFAMGYIPFDRVLEPLKHGRAFVAIPFSSFYDIRQGRPFRGCFIEIHVGGEAS